jgi:OOP family OmpA-OmpF porin
MLAACADQGSPPVAAAAPEMVGAWYQVFFDTDKADLSPRGQLIVSKVAEVVTKNDNVRVTVIGRTDRAGTATANMALSERRAELVRDALIAAGVPSARIDTSWLGEGKQDAPTPDDVAQQRNRVVDIVVQEPA